MDVGSCLPDPIPALGNYYRVPEAGIATRQYIGLDRNERVAPLPDWFMDRIREAVTSQLLTWYPVQDALERELSQHLDLPEVQLLLTPSGDSAIRSLCHAYVRPGDGMVMLEPSYAMFPVYARMFDARAVSIPYDADLVLKTELLLESVVPGVRLLFIANPNQPTGTLVDEGVLKEVLRRAAVVNALVVMDEAYYPFSHVTALPWIDAHPNLVVMRTFSKAAGLAGLRIGFLAGHADVIANLYKVRVMNDMNSFAMLCAAEVLKYPEIVDDYVAEVEEGGRYLAKQLSQLGLTVFPTHANFLLIRVAPRCRPAQLVEDLKGRGFLVKALGDYPSVEGCIRVTLGPRALMVEFVDALRQVLELETSVSARIER